MLHRVLRAGSVNCVVVAGRHHLPRFARLMLRGGSSFRCAHILARIPVNGVTIGSCRIVDRLGVVTVR